MFVGLWMVIDAVDVPPGGHARRLRVSLPLLAACGRAGSGTGCTWRRWSRRRATAPWATSWCSGGTALLLARAWGALGARAVKVGLLLGAMALSLFLFAGFAESRIWFEFIPFTLLLWDAAPTPRQAPDGSVSHTKATTTAA